MKRLLSLAAAAAALLVAGAASAGVTGGSIWENDMSNDASVIPAGAPDSTFTTAAINYDSNVGGYTIGGFLNDPTGTHFSNPGIAGHSLLNTHIQLVGTIGLLAGDNTFVVGHDDGLILSIAGFGEVLHAPNPTSFSTTPFTVHNGGAAGNFAFQLDYNECCGPPAELLFKVNDVVIGGGVPEPAAWSMMIVGFGAAGALMRKSRKAATA